MTDQNGPERTGLNPWLMPGIANVKLIYLLYLASLVLGVTVLIGVIFAYLNRRRSEDWIDTHYTYLIRTFWLGLLYGAIALALSILVIGFLIFAAIAVWFILRCLTGLQRAARGEPVANPEAWLI